MADGYVADQAGEILFLKYLGHQPHIAVHPDALAVRCRDARALLASVLQREQPEERNSRHVLALGMIPITPHSSWISGRSKSNI